MIKRYTDHSANERTYLAWIRTAIAIMAFGFLIEKFDLFMAYMGQVTGSPAFVRSPMAEYIGLGLFLVGVMIVVSATWRFFDYKKLIETDETIPYDVKRTNLVLSVLMVALALFLFFYLGHQLFFHQ